MRTLWTVAETKRNAEGEALTHVSRQGFQAYLPRYREQNVNGVRKVSPLLPGYIFINITKRDPSPLRSTRGISRMMYQNGELARVLASDIERFQSMEDELGYVRLVDEEPPVFESGQVVTAMSGMFCGVSGFYKMKTSAQRCRVVFEMMGRAVESEMLLRDLVA